MIEDLKPLLGKLTTFAKDRLKFENPPRLFIRQDSKNGRSMLGRTAHYDPGNSAITIFVTGRHPKDILRSFCHELVHHCQNERGDLRFDNMKTMNRNYAQENEHMRKMEEEAYLQGNMCFRDWEDGLDNKLQYRMSLAEQKFLKESKKMSVKISRKDLKEMIRKILSEQDDSPKGKMTMIGPTFHCKMEGEPEVEWDPEKEPQYNSCAEKARALSKAKKASAESGKQMNEFANEPDRGYKRDDDDDDLNETGYKRDEDENDDLKEADCGCPDLKEEGAKIITPEQENRINEARFNKRHEILFEKLKKKWTK